MNMDPFTPASFDHRSERLSTGHTYHFVDQLPKDYNSKSNLTLLCIHGFPDLWYGWRYQIGPWVRNGFRVVVPDMLGYGGTDKPQDPSDYSTRRLCADLAALLDLLGVQRAVIIGHDWGAFTAGRFALWHPERVYALIMLSVAYTPPTRTYLPIEDVARLAPNLGYQADFASAASTSVIESNLRKFLSITFKAAKSGQNYTPRGSLFKLLQNVNIRKEPSVLNDNEFQIYLANLSSGGMNGPLNYYRTSKNRHEEEASAGLPSNLPADLPVLFMWGTADPTATPVVIEKSRKFIVKLQDVAFEGKGHWLMVEAKEEVTEKVQTWLGQLRSQTPIIMTGKL